MMDVGRHSQSKKQQEEDVLVAHVVGRRHAQKLCLGSVTARIAKRAFLCVISSTIINCDCVVIAWFISEQGGIFMSSGTVAF